ncbi:MAG TPA: hypothetical protein P5514_04885 [Bacteroidales bacterium]|nr:hypothetical protein [Bacteroidales bacterium]HRX96257.1 hypothetical protein [Bacteroidales bacterium]
MAALQDTESINELLGDSSRKGIDLVVQLVGDNPVLFKQFLEITLREKGALSQRASRVVNFATLNHPGLFKPYAVEIVAKMPDMKHDSVKREIIKTFADHDFDMDEVTTSKLLEICFKWFTDQNEKIAVQAYALDVLYKISNQYPDLKFELISVIEQQREFMSTGMKARIAKMLPMLIKEINLLT